MKINRNIEKNKKVLVLFYSQSGQLKSVINKLIKPIEDNAMVCVDYQKIEPISEYTFPWKLTTFFNIFPETVAMKGCKVKKLKLKHKDYDLIILGYTIWYLTPSIPTIGFLNTDQAKEIFANKPVITVIACRNMWMIAHEKLKLILKNLQSTLITNIALIDQGKSLYTFVTMPRWMLTGKKNKFWFFPQAGISNTDLEQLDHIGKVVVKVLISNKIQTSKLLENLNQIEINQALLNTERRANKIFQTYSRFILKFGRMAFTRALLLSILIFLLPIAIILFVPITYLIKQK